jgi:hypothetical protein
MTTPEMAEVLIDPGKSSHALGPGVFGYSVETPDGLYIPVVQAQREGQGDVGRWLDSLPTDRRIVFASVFSPRLAGMLERRGWTFVSEFDPRTGEDVPCWERGPRGAVA